MIKEFSAHAKSSNKTARYVFFACLGSTIIMTLVYILAWKFKGLIGFVDTIFITATIYIYNRYMGTEYFYDVTFDHMGAPVFVVRHRIGKRETTICRIDLNSVVNVVKMPKEKRKTYKPDKDVIKYSYYPTMSPDTLYLMTVRSHIEKADVFVEISDEMAALLLSYSEEARCDDNDIL